MGNPIEQAVLVRVQTDGTPSITKLTDELSKLRAQATATAGGAAPLGGALGSAGDGADKLSTFVAQARAELAQMSAQASKLGAEYSSLASSTSGLAGAFGVLMPVALGVAAGITGIRSILGPMAEAAGKAEESQIRLANAVKQTGATIEDQTGRINAAVKQTAGVSIFDETSLRNAAALFTTITGNAGAAEDALQPIVDLSAALGIGLDESAKMVARAGEGMVGSLGRAGIVFTDIEQKQLAAATSGERLAMVFAKIEEKTGGSAAAQLQTYAGQVTQLKNEWSDLLEQLGNMGPLEAAKNFIAGLKVYLDLFGDSIDQDKDKLQAFYASADRIQSGVLAGEVGATKGKVGGLYAPAGQMTLVGPSGDEVNLGIQKANDLAAALAKVQERAVSMKEATDAVFRDIGKMQIEIQVGLQPPETDPVKKAVQEVADWASRELEKIGDKEVDLTNKIASGLATAAALRAETAKMQSTPGTDPAAITQNQQLVALILQQVGGYKAALIELQKLPAAVKATEDAQSKIAADNALAEMARKAAEELHKVDGEIERATEKASHAFDRMLIPDEVLQDLRAKLKQIAEEESKQLKAAVQFGQVFGGGDFGAVAAGLQAATRGRANDERAALQSGAESIHKAITDAFDTGVQDIIDGLSTGFQAATTGEFQARIRQLLTDLGIKPDTPAFEAAAASAGTKFAQSAADGLRQAVDGLSHQLADILTDVAITGGKNFGEIGAKIFQDNLAKNLQGLLGQAILGALGGKPTQREGESTEDFQARVTDTNLQQTRVVNAVSGLVGGIGQIITMFDNAKKGQQVSVLGSALGFAATGASIGTAISAGLGTVIGALVGAVIGGVTAAIANNKALKSLPYATFGVREGQAYVEPYPGMEKNFGNLTTQQYNSMLHQVQAQFDDTTAEYIKILLKFPSKVLAAVGDLSLKSLDFSPTYDLTKQVTDKWKLFWGALTGGVWGAIFNDFQVPKKTVDVPGSGELTNPQANKGKDALKTFQQDFDNWVNNTLPKELSEQFKGKLETVFTAMGITVDRFNEIWAKLDGMDSKDRAQVFSDIADGVVALGRVFDTLDIVRRQFKVGMAQDTLLDQFGQARGRTVSDFQQGLIDQGEQLIKLGIAIQTLPLKDQAAAFAQLGQSLDALRGNLINFLNTLISMSKQASDSIAEARTQIKLDQAPTPQAKSDILLEQLRITEAQINRAGANPDEVQRAINRSIELINQLYQLDPTKRADWADKALADLDKLQQEAFKRMGEVAINQFQFVVDAMKPVIESFEKVADPLDGLTTSADNASKAFDNFAGKLNGGGGGKFHEPTDDTGPQSLPPTPQPPAPPPTPPPPAQPTNPNRPPPGSPTPPHAPTPRDVPPATPPPAAPAPQGMYYSAPPAFSQPSTPTGPTPTSTPAQFVPRNERTILTPNGEVTTFGPSVPPAAAGGGIAPTPESMTAVLGILKHIDAALPAPETFAGILRDLDQLVGAPVLSGGAVLPPLAPIGDGDQEQVPLVAPSSPRDEREDLAPYLERLIQQVGSGADSNSQGQASLAGRLDTAISLLSGCLSELRLSNDVPAETPEVRVVMPSSSTGSYRQGAITRRLNARQ